ncbi:MAG: flagellar protein FliS [Gammaproteobacteria bacterium]|nr:flagellar protein FliS [Gammaproteobacteria bacterium]
MEQLNTQTQALLNDYVYNRDLENELSENPHSYILLLLQRTVEKGLTAKECHDCGNLVAKGFHLGRMTTLVDALRDRLVFKDQNIVAYNFAELYEYVDFSIQQAVHEAGTEYLESAILIMNELKHAWEEAILITGKSSAPLQ